MLYLFGLFVCFGSLFSAYAKELPNASATFLEQCAKMTSGCEEQLFLELSKTYRPSKEEDELREYIKQVAAVSSDQFWKTNIPVQQDAIGNLLITLPATGAFKTRADVQPFALQSHMDIVLAVANAKPGEDLRPYFRNGVDVELKNGWYQAKNHQTTLGADNGIGVAIALRYLIDPTIAHPPLELIFTVQEESGLTGAFQNQLDIKSTQMLCLDGMTPEQGEIIAGSQGSNANWIKITDAPVLVSENQYDLVHVTVTNLAGGHSGGDIFRDRLNAIKALGLTVNFVREKTGAGVYIKSAIAGNVGIYNKIPSLFSLELIVSHQPPASDLPPQVEKFLHDLINLNADDAAKAQVDVRLESLISSIQGLSAELSAALVNGILQSPNGIVDHDSKYDHQILTSNNLSFLNLDMNSSPMVMDLAYFTRGFDFPKIKAIGERINGLFDNLSSSSKTNIENKVSYEPWLEPDSSHLLQTVMSIGTFTKKYYLNAGLEPSAFRVKIKNLEVIALGPYIQEAHSVGEKLRKDSIEPVVQGIRAIVQRM